MKMSWLFGRKKHHKDSPPDSTEEDQASSEQDDNFVHIEQPNSMPLSVGGNGPVYPTNSLWEMSGMGRVPPYFGTSVPSLPKADQVENPHYLSGVPFELCKQLKMTMNSDLDSDMCRIDQILSYIERAEDQNYDYDFSLENSVVAELNSINDE